LGTPSPLSLHVSVQSAGGGAGGAGGEGGGGGVDGTGGGGGVDGGKWMPRVVCPSVAPTVTEAREWEGRPIALSKSERLIASTSTFAFALAFVLPSTTRSFEMQPGGGGGGGDGGYI